jgi:hypothetical protein
MLIAAGALQRRARSHAAACPPDPAMAAACAVTKDYSIRIYWFSVTIYVIGAFFAFAAPLLLS